IRGRPRQTRRASTGASIQKSLLLLSALIRISAALHLLPAIVNGRVHVELGRIVESDLLGKPHHQRWALEFLSQDKRARAVRLLILRGLVAAVVHSVVAAERVQVRRLLDL